VQITNDLDPPAMAGGDIQDCDVFVDLDADIPPIWTLRQWTILSPPVTTESFVDFTDPKTRINGLIAGTTYNLQWQVNNGACMSFDDLFLTIDLPPTVPNAGPNQLLCAFSTMLAANTPTSGTGLWALTGVGSGTFADATNPNTMVSSLGLGLNTFQWTITNTCSALSDFVDITNNAAPLANAGPDDILCNNMITTTLAANDPSILDATASGSWFISSGVGGSFTPNNTVANATFDGVLGQTYVLEWTVTNPACGAQPPDPVTIQFNNQPVADAGVGGDVCVKADGPRSGNLHDPQTCTSYHTLHRT